jgi:hypothetical protein
MDRNFLAWAVRYFNYISSVFSTGRAAEPHFLLEMTRTNILESLGPDWAGSVAELERQSRSFGDIPAIAGDARVLPHEWLRTPDGWLKADTLDHHADHFYPGPADIAWDVAGFGVEFGLGEAAITDFALAVGGPILPARLPFYRTAYLAFRLGYTTLAAETLAGSADGRRMARLADRYRQALQRQLACL